MSNLDMDVPSSSNAGTQEMNIDAIARNTNHNLPQELVIEILSRLPAKHLWQLRFVSKTWFQLITLDPCFAQLHWHNSTQSFNPSVLALPSRISEKHFLYLATDYTTCDEAVPLKLPCYQEGDILRSSFSNYHHLYRIWNVCNGMLCCARDSKVCIWNPLTNNYITIPCPPIPRPYSYMSFTIFGFGFDQAANKYKVVRVVNSLHTLACVYVLGASSSWRIIDEDMPYKLRAIDISLLHGALHWLTYSENLIVAFDLKDEVFRELLPPPSDNPLHHLELQEMGGFLCIVDISKTNFDMWMMKQYGVFSSWTKQFSIRTAQECVLNSELGILGIAHTGEIILKHCNLRRRILMLYDPETRSVRNLKQFTVPCSVQGTFRGSIISPRVINGSEHISTDEERRSKSKKR